MKSDKIVWGLILVFIGTILLLDNFNVINFYWGSVWRLWPVMLILFGAEMLFARSSKAGGPWIAGIITLVVLVFVGWYGSTHRPEHSRWSFDWHNDDSDSSDSGDVRRNTFSEPYLSTISRAELNVSGGATSYELNDTTSNLFSADIEQRFGNYSLTKSSRDSMEVLTFQMNGKHRTRGRGNFSTNKAVLRLNSNPVWNINMEMGAGETDFDLSRFKVASLKLEGGAASFEVKLGEPVGTTNVDVQTGVADVDLDVPSSVGCRIEVETGLSSKDFEGFEKQSDGVYVTSNYQSAAKKIHIKLQGGISDFTVRRY
ncbi:MAG TPA: DUF5668 domain-containing protein [Sphingobacteriaceae bacterium]